MKLENRLKMSNFNGKFLIAFITLLVTTMINGSDDVKAAFAEHEVVPDVIPKAPEEFLKVTYENDLRVKNGNELTPTQVKNQPKLEWNADANTFYTLIMTDPDAPSRKEPKVREFKHWIVSNIPGNDIEKGEVLAGYVGSGPPEGTGLHRYVFLVYKQPGKLVFEEEIVGNNSRKDRPKFKAAEFSKKYGLGDPVAGNFYQAQYDDYVPKVHAQLSEN